MDVAGVACAFKLSRRLRVVFLDQCQLARKYRYVTGAAARQRAVRGRRGNLIERDVAHEVSYQSAGPLLQIDLGGAARKLFVVVLSCPCAGDVQPGGLVGQPEHVAGVGGRAERQRPLEIGGSAVETAGKELRETPFVLDFRGAVVISVRAGGERSAVVVNCVIEVTLRAQAGSALH